MPKFRKPPLFDDQPDFMPPERPPLPPTYEIPQPPAPDWQPPRDFPPYGGSPQPLPPPMIPPGEIRPMPPGMPPPDAARLPGSFPRPRMRRRMPPRPPFGKF